MIISQFNKHYGHEKSRFFFVTYKDSSSYGKTKISEAITRWEDRTPHYYTFKMEFIK